MRTRTNPRNQDRLWKMLGGERVAKMSAPATRSGPLPDIDESDNDPLFIAVHATGLAYCDRRKEQHGDYLRLGFLPYDTLELEYAQDLGNDLWPRVRADVKLMQARKGQCFEYSACGQWVTLGNAA